jgi:hypothetical protein
MGLKAREELMYQVQLENLNEDGEHVRWDPLWFDEDKDSALKYATRLANSTVYQVKVIDFYEYPPAEWIVKPDPKLAKEAA